MPIYLRNFTHKKIVEHYENEAKAVEKAEKGQQLSKSSNQIVPEHVQKAMRKSDIKI